MALSYAGSEYARLPYVLYIHTYVYTGNLSQSDIQATLKISPDNQGVSAQDVNFFIFLGARCMHKIYVLCFRETSMSDVRPAAT